MGRVAQDPSTTAEFLSATNLFRSVERAVIDKIAPHILAHEFTSGERIMRAASPEQSLGILFSGRASVRSVNAATGVCSNVEELRVGDSFGEIGAVLGTAQSQEIVADDVAVALIISKEVLAQLTSKIAPFSHALAKRLASKLVMASISALRGGGASAGPVTTEPVALTFADEKPAGKSAGGGAADGIRFARVASYNINDKVLAMVAAKTIQQNRVLPLELRGSVLTVGMVDPFHVAAQADIRRTLSNVDIEIVAISQDDFNEAFVRYRLDASAAT
jgi:CRP-like cAMP-binding protein